MVQARGSLYELETQVQISANLGLLSSVDHQTISDKTLNLGRALNSFIESLKKQKAK
jgi:four helix bundle protein